MIEEGEGEEGKKKKKKREEKQERQTKRRQGGEKEYGVTRGIDFKESPTSSTLTFLPPQKIMYIELEGKKIFFF